MARWFRCGPSPAFSQHSRHMRVDRGAQPVRRSLRKIGRASFRGPELEANRATNWSRRRSRNFKPHASGSAIEAASRIWALEFAPVRINTIVPGIINTPIWESMLGADAAAEQLNQTAIALPVKRVGEPTDVAKAAAFLIDNGFVNGATLVVDGGHRLI